LANAVYCDYAAFNAALFMRCIIERRYKATTYKEPLILQMKGSESGGYHKEFYARSTVRAAADSRGALTPSNVPRTFSVRLNRFTGTMHAVHIGSLGTALERGERR